MLKNNAPITEPYIVELIGEEVIEQLPLLQPIWCQYRKPTMAPTAKPIRVR